MKEMKKNLADGQKVKEKMQSWRATRLYQQCMKERKECEHANWKNEEELVKIKAEYEELNQMMKCVVLKCETKTALKDSSLSQKYNVAKQWSTMHTN